MVAELCSREIMMQGRAYERRPELHAPSIAASGEVPPCLLLHRGKMRARGRQAAGCHSEPWSEIESL
jgi:hypothetical protein